MQRLQQCTEIEVAGLHPQLAGLDLREVEDVADDVGQRLCAFDDLVEVLAPAGVVGALVARQPGQTNHAVERRAQFVAGVGQKGALGAVGGFGVVACARQRLLGSVALGDVFDDPHRAALGRVQRIDDAATHEGQEAAAVLALRHALLLHHFAARQPRADLLAQLLIGVLPRPDLGA